MQALFLLITVAVLVAILISDIATAVLDPRTREAELAMATIRSSAARPRGSPRPLELAGARRGRRRCPRQAADLRRPLAAADGAAITVNRKATAGHGAAGPVLLSWACSLG